uniref:Uncharacterized protein n=1 Tax=Lepeophtheirus salmonis TaxID=72036 RepID=A0A0K2TA42_LEPSM
MNVMVGIYLFRMVLLMM